MSDVRALLSSIGERADDLTRSLAALDGERLHNWQASLQQYQQLSQQLQLLEEKGDDPVLDHFVPEPVGVGEQPRLIPQLLSTRLDKKQEDERDADVEQARAHADEAASEEALAEHNRTLDAAWEHLATRARELDLPGAATLLAGRATAPRRANEPGASTVRGTVAPPDRHSPAAAEALLAVLRGRDPNSGERPAKQQRL